MRMEEEMRVLGNEKDEENRRRKEEMEKEEKQREVIVAKIHGENGDNLDGLNRTL